MIARFQLKKICGREPQGVWRHDELIGGKPPVVKTLTLTLIAKKSKPELTEALYILYTHSCNNM
jgi:hypothetical protein